jgi:hypothetical protein
MSDGSEGSGPIPRRTPRTSDGGAPVSGALAIVLAVVAVVVGFLILRSISGDDDQQLGIPSGSSDTTGDDQSSTTAPNGSTATTLPTVTTEPPLTVDGATVVVANANDIGGSAQRMATALETGPHFTLGEPIDAADPVPIDVSVVYFDSTQLAAEAVAQSVARALGGGVNVIPMPATGPPVQGGDIGDAGVLLMLGLDKADKTLAELNPGSVSTVTNPVVAGSTLAP